MLILAIDTALDACSAGVLDTRASKLIARAGLYRRIWHPALFDFALFICVVAGLVFASKELLS